MNQDSEGIQSHITDSKELTQARRIRALLERRARVIDSLEAVSLAETKGATEATESRLAFVSHLRSLILDLYPLLIQSGKLGDADESIGTFTIDPPENVPTDIQSPDLEPGADAPVPREKIIDSLDWFTEHTFPMRVTWTVQWAGSRGEEECTKEVVPPVRLCLVAAKRAMTYMAELNIDIEAHEEQGTFGFDYDELESNEELDNE